MRRLTIRRVALIAAAVAAVAGCAPAATAAPGVGEPPSWHIVKQVHNGRLGNFTAVAAVGRSGGWAFNYGSVPTAWRLGGPSWTQVPFPGLANEQVVAAGAVSASDVWAFTNDGTWSRALRWNGSTWSRTSLAALLPAQQQLNNPVITGIYAQSRDSVYAIGNGNAGDAGGPLVILHWNGSAWSRVAQGNYGIGTLPDQQVSSDGHGGLWIPMPGYAGIGQKGYLLHYSAGQLTAADLPGRPYRISVDAVALIPGTTDLLGGGETHAVGNAGSNVTAVILQYGA